MILNFFTDLNKKITKLKKFMDLKKYTNLVKTIMNSETKSAN